MEKRRAVKRVIDEFFKALDRRGIALKAAARMSDTDVVKLRRIRNGETKSLDIDVFHKVALAVTDQREFIIEVLGIDVDPQKAASVLALTSRLAAVQGSIAAHWLVDDGSSIPAPAGLAAGVGDITGARIADPEEAIERACRVNGWIGWSGSNGIAELRYDFDTVDPTIAAQAVGLIRSQRDTVRYRIRDGRPGGLMLTPEEAVLVLERRIRAGRRPPPGWIDRELPIAEADKRLRALVEAFTRGANTPADLIPMLDGGLASLYSVSSHEREAFCIQIGQRFNSPTVQDAGKRVLDRRENVVYSAMVDRHVIEAALRGQPAVTRLGIDFDGKRQVIYDRLALPFSMAGNSYVLTTSTIHKDTSAPAAP